MLDLVWYVGIVFLPYVRTLGFGLLCTNFGFFITVIVGFFINVIVMLVLTFPL